MTSDLTISGAINQQQKTANSGTKLAQDFTQFLTLLTVQLQNQDPLSPMDTTEFTNQLVAFTGVEQQINTNQKLDALVSMALGNSFTSSLGYVGLDVSYLSSEFHFDGQNKNEITYALDEQAVEGKIRVRDESGKVIYTADANKTVGVHKFSWDGSLTNGGKAAEGTYTVTVEALNSNDEPIDSSIVVTGRVRGVETQNGQLFVLVGERAVPVSSILNAVKPPQTPVTTPEEESV